MRKESQIETVEKLVEVPDAWAMVSTHRRPHGMGLEKVRSNLQARGVTKWQS